MKKLKILLLLPFLLLVFSSTAIALPVEAGPFYANFINLEWINPNTTDWNTSGQEDTWGIANVTQYDHANISGGGGFSPDGYPWTWEQGDFGKELTGIFYNIDIVSFSGFPGPFALNSTGGHMDIWINDVGTLDWSSADKSDRIGTSGFAGITDDANSQLWLSLDFVPFTTDGANDYTIWGAGTTDSVPIVVSSNAYLNVTGGYMASVFDTNYFNLQKANKTWITADFHLKNSADPFVERGWTNHSEDPVEGYAVPEPATMLLLGTGLIGLAVLGRRKFFKKG